MNNPTNNKEIVAGEMREAVDKSGYYQSDSKRYVVNIESVYSLITTALTKAREDERARCVEAIGKNGESDCVCGKYKCHAWTVLNDALSAINKLNDDAPAS